MDQQTLDKLIDIEGALNGILVELNGITATGADGPTLEAIAAKLKAQVVVIHGITATGAD